MVLVGSSPTEQQSPYGDGRYLLRMLLGERTAPPPAMAAPIEQTPVGPPTQLGAPINGDIYVDDPMANAELNPLANTPPVNTRPNVPPVPMARPGVSNTPMAKPVMDSPSQPAVRSMMDNIEQTLLNGNSVNAAPAQGINNIDGDPRPPQPQDDNGGGWNWTDLVKGAGIAALIAAILTGRGRAASEAVPGRAMTPYDPGMSGTILSRDRLTGPQAAAPTAKQIETDILNVTPNELGAQPRGALTGPNDAVVAQGKSQSVAPDVINQPGPNAQRGLTRQGVSYRGRTYFEDGQGNIVDRNGDIVRTSAVEQIKRMFEQQRNQPGRR